MGSSRLPVLRSSISSSSVPNRTVRTSHHDLSSGCRGCRQHVAGAIPFKCYIVVQHLEFVYVSLNKKITFFLGFFCPRPGLLRLGNVGLSD